MTMKPCSPSQIRNPETRRCVSRTGAIGRKILGGRAASSERSESRRREKARRQRHSGQIYPLSVFTREDEPME
jgi:hypothetical protein